MQKAINPIVSVSKNNDYIDMLRICITKYLDIARQLLKSSSVLLLTDLRFDCKASLNL